LCRKLTALPQAGSGAWEADLAHQILPIPLVRDRSGILTAANQGRALAALRDRYWSHSELRF